MVPDFLHKPPHPLAYSQQEGDGPTVLFLSGFKSDMTGTKASHLAAHCATRGQGFVRFDYSGHGQSGGDFMDGTIGGWLADALSIIDNITGGPLLLVGSSMGGWLALLAARARPERIKSIVGIAAAPDFTEALIWEKLNNAQKTELMENGVYYAPSCYGEAPYPITRRLIEEARTHLLLSPREGRGEGLPYIPLHLLHGTQDEDVPISVAHQLLEKIPHATLTTIEGGDHRLSHPEHLQLLCEALDTMLSNLKDTP